jgi:hypothetical protein
MNKIVCLYCGRVLTWAGRQFQFVRLLRPGLPGTRPRAWGPPCHPCTSGQMEGRGLRDPDPPAPRPPEPKPEPAIRLRPRSVRS